MRLEKRSWGFKGICVCHTNQEVSLHSEANLNRRPRAERGRHPPPPPQQPGPAREAAVDGKAREEALTCACACLIETHKGRETQI